MHGFGEDLAKDIEAHILPQTVCVYRLVWVKMNDHLARSDFVKIN